MTVGRPRKNPKLNGPFNDLIDARMKVLGIESYDAFAEFAGIGRSTLFGIIRGRLSENGTWMKPSVETLVKLAEALNVPAHELLYMLEPDARGAESVQFNPELVAVSILSYAGAGPGQDHPLDENHVYVSRTFAAGKRLGAFQIKGNSMAGGKRPIYDGDTVIVNFLDKGSSGDAIIARLHDHIYVCKALKIDKFGAMLTSLNPLYTNNNPAVIPADQVEEVIGKVVRVIGNVESLEE